MKGSVIISIQKVVKCKSKTSDFTVNKMKEARRNENLVTLRLLINIFGSNNPKI